MSTGIGTLCAFPIILVNIEVGDPSGTFEAVIIRICETQIVYKIQTQILKETAESQLIEGTPIVMIPENSWPAKPMHTAQY
jgi:hypothetical protein